MIFIFMGTSNHLANVDLTGKKKVVVEINSSRSYDYHVSKTPYIHMLAKLYSGRK